MADEEKSLQLDEISVLGNIFLDSKGDNMLTAAQRLVPEDFTDPRNREIFRACVSLNNKGVNPDFATVEEELKNAKVLDAIGGETYLSEILEKAVTQGSIDNYIVSVKEKSVLNRFLSKLTDIINDAKNKPIDDVSEFIGKSADDVLAIAQQRNVAEAKSMKEISANVVAHLVKQTKEFQEQKEDHIPGVTGVPTGYDRLNVLTKGWHKGDMIVVGARPSVGKTAFALNLLYKVAKTGKPVVFFSLEMSSISIAMRLLSLTSGLSTDEINKMEFLPGSTVNTLLVDTHGSDEIRSKAQKLQRGILELANCPIYIDDNPGSKMMDISTKCKKLQNAILQERKENIALVAIDYIGLITSPSKANAASRQQEVSDISRQIKQMARQLDVPVLALTQLSRESEKRTDHRPQMSDIRDSGSIEQDADMIFMLYREDYYTKQQKFDEGESEDQASNEADNSPISTVNVALMKNRNGQTGSMTFIFDKEHCSFNLADFDHPDEEA